MADMIASHTAMGRDIINYRITGSASSTESLFHMGVSNEELATIIAECLMSSFLVAHNIPLAVSDHMTPDLKQMFLKSKEVQKYSCKRTKTTHIVHVTSKDNQNKIAAEILKHHFSVCTDGSADKGGKVVFVFGNMADNRP